MRSYATTLWRRRQFILGASPQPEIPWPHRSVGGLYSLQYHPDLTCIQAERRGNIELTLIGDIVDPRKVEASNLAILQRFQDEMRCAKDLVNLTRQFGGRWLIIADDGHTTIVHNDACGLRSAFYCSDMDLGPACGSQAELIAAGRLTPDARAESEFLSSDYVRRDPEWWWPGDTCAYQQIKRLLPNHYLDFRNQTAHRFWPVRSLERISPDEAVIKASELLRGLVEAAARRFPLALPLTAGFDSRVILAASRGVARDLFCYTIKMPHLSQSDPDIFIPSRLLRKLGLKHHVVPASSPITAPFSELLKNNVNPSHEVAGGMAEALLRCYPNDAVCLTGHAVEIARCGYYWRACDHPKDVTVPLLARLAGMHGDPFALDAFEEWLRGALEGVSGTGLPLLDLFYWEQRVGSWAASGAAQWDVFQERFPPFGCRELQELLLGVDPSWREHPDYRLFVGVAKRLWPEVLSEPINPRKRIPLTRRVRSILGRVRRAVG